MNIGMWTTQSNSQHDMQQFTLSLFQPMNIVNFEAPHGMSSAAAHLTV